MKDVLLESESENQSLPNQRWSMTKLTDQQGNKRSQSDESYIIDLCDAVLNSKALRQHRFSFLKGDAGTPLPVDAYYPEFKLVIEYREKQHTEAVKFFDKRQTASGVTRGEQRKIYDQRRRDILPQQDIVLIEFDVNEFHHDGRKRLSRNHDKDRIIITQKLKNFLK